MFDNIAHRYDALNRTLSLGIDIYWRNRAIALLRDAPKEKVLDIATGTADVALAMARKYPTDVKKIIGLDISQEMLEYGRKKVRRQSLEHIIELVHGDSENLPYSDNTFDAITVSFGVRNFENLEGGLTEMYRVLKPSGKVIVLEFSQPTGMPIKQLYNFYFKNILPIVGRITSKDERAYTYLFESVQAFPFGNEFIRILNKIGYKNATCTPLTFGICSIYFAEK